MSKLVAFRMPDDLFLPFADRCALESLTTTDALVTLVRGWLARSPPMTRMAPERGQIDHKDGNPRNNEIMNVRVVRKPIVVTEPGPLRFPKEAPGVRLKGAKDGGKKR